MKRLCRILGLVLLCLALYTILGMTESSQVYTVTETHFASQMGQDKYLWEEIFKKNPQFGQGFFIEFGARNGIEHSNTYFYEKELGWKGLLAEAMPYEQANIVQNRHCLLNHTDPSYE